jgi:hypothetical protein
MAQEAAALLGLARHGAILSNTGIFWSLSLQHQLNALVKRSGTSAVMKQRWWGFQRLPFDTVVLRDLELMRRFLPEPDAEDLDPFSYWWRPIGLLIPRTSNTIALSDASYEGMGGWSPTLDFMWRLTWDDLLAAGFDMRLIDLVGKDLRQFQDCFPDDDRGLHINILELIAIFINTWLVLYHIRWRDAPTGGWIVNIQADNTSALSWLHFAARSHRHPVVVNLTMICQCLISFSHTDQIARFQGTHIPGIDNSHYHSLPLGIKSPLTFPWSLTTLKASISNFIISSKCMPLMMIVMNSLIAFVMHANRMR